MKKEIYIQNLKCGGCVNSITKGIKNIEGVILLEINVEKSMVVVDVSEESNFIKVEEKLKELGYPPLGKNNNIIAKTKSFISCASGRLASNT